jgi:eukaryotic-like serine/threonine-protein kinase
LRKRESTQTARRVELLPGYWVPGMVALLLVLLLASFGLLQPLERWIYATTLSAFAPPADSGKVAVIELESDLRQSDLDEVLRRVGSARAVAFFPQLHKLDNAAALEALDRRLKPVKSNSKKRRTEPYRTLGSLHRELDTRTQLLERFSKNDNVILALPYHPGGSFVGTMQSEFGEVATGGVPLFNRLPSLISPRWQTVESLTLPDESLRKAAVGSGLYTRLSIDGGYPSLLQYQDKTLPGLLFQLLRLNYRAMQADKVHFRENRIDMAVTKVATDNAYRLRPYANLEDSELKGINRYPFARVAAGTYAISTFRNKTVFIGELQQVAPLALAMDALLQQQVVAHSAWSVWGQYGALIAMTLLAMLLLPRLRFSTASVSTLLLVFLLFNGEFLLLLLGRVWIPLMLPVLVLLFSYPAIVFRTWLSRREDIVLNELSYANRQLGRMLQAQGELDQALEKYRRCRVDAPLLEQLYHLGLDFERKRQFAKAVSTLQYIDSVSPAFRDVAERIQRNQAMEQRIVLTKGGAASTTGTVIMDAEGLQKPIIGHYEVEKEIGRGAMGMVYLGRDPRIGRMVAIKTMALSDEFSGTQLDEVKQRFYREAETAGRLNHPNIVHVYDIGEDQELAFIAMDFLAGKDLGHFVKPKQLLPIKTVLEVVKQVAGALDYAHKKKVVHRDIKPANIIYDEQAGVAKVTDFGVACLTDSSKTRTGTVLGSPSYMSPEQVAGKRVDGRADIFSLGVTLFQMLTGHLPFEADSLGSLMYKITNEEHPKPGKFRKGLPSCAVRIINKCLQKDPGSRYQSGAELVAALERCSQ